MREVHDLSPQQLSEIIRGDGIHVLFDLTGTNGSRVPCMESSPQVSWLGFPGTSGLETMDYLFRSILGANQFRTNYRKSAD